MERPTAAVVSVAPIGLRPRETFSDHRHVIIYGQRSADDRLVFGGRGAPYHFASRIKPEFDRDERVFGMLRSTLVDLFPVLVGLMQWGDRWCDDAGGGPVELVHEACGAHVGVRLRCAAGHDVAPADLLLALTPTAEAGAHGTPRGA